MEENQTRNYVFPIQARGSILFYVKGARVHGCALVVNDTIVDTAEPKYETNDPAEEVHLKFLNGERFHAGLLEGCDIKLYVNADAVGVPQLGMRIIDTEINAVAGDTYEQKVTIETTNGPAEIVLVYERGKGCHFRR